MKHTFLTFGMLALALLGPAAAPAQAAANAQLPEGAKIVALEAEPKQIALATQHAYAQVLLTATLDSGDRVDVTRLAQASVANDLAEVSATGVVRPKHDGDGQITYTVAGQSLDVPLKVSGSKDNYTANFVRDVMPVLSKSGCNAGTCHGSLNGKNGFKLSLRGYDPLHDHRALTDDIESRRINRAAPDQSMMLLKPSGVIPHVGGVMMQPGQPYYELIRSWILGGVKVDLDTPRVTGIEIFPKNPIVPLPGMTQQMHCSPPMPMARCAT